MRDPYFYPIGTAGLAWVPAELAQWRTRQGRQRSCVIEVLCRVEPLRASFDVSSYGDIRYADEHFLLMAIRSLNWQADLPCVLVTGGVHGYETSGVHGALRFVEQHAHRYAGQVNLLVVPCVSPWAYERFQRWNFDVIDPNRSFRAASPAQESAALMRLMAPLHGQFVAHIDLHETTDSDESEFRPAVAARDGKTFEPCTIPDGFYLVDDSANPQPAFQQALIQAVQQVTHIASAGAQGGIIGSPLVAPGVIHSAMQALGLCAGIIGARYTATTEVYPDSPRATPEQCVAAQVAVVCAALDFVCH